MRHSTFFRQALLLCYGMLLLFAMLVMTVYTVISPGLFANNKIEDLTAKGQIISGYIESTLRGEISTAYLVPLIGRSTAQWEATVWVVDTEGDTLIRTQQSDDRRVGNLPASLSQPMMPQVLDGCVSTHIGTTEDLKASAVQKNVRQPSSDVLSGLAAQGSEADAAEEVLTGSLVAVAVPITFFGEVVGAVFMAQSMTEVISGMQALNNTISFSLLIVALLVLPVALFFATRLSRPLLQMYNVAMTMAGGDLSVRANDLRNDEFGELGHALNYLSGELGATLSTLQTERSRLKSTIDGLSEGIISLDECGRILFTNPALHTLLALETDTPQAVTAALPELRDMCACALSDGEPSRRTLWHGSLALHIAVTPLKREDGAICGAVGIVSDVTSAERLEQTRRDYVANVSHELRTPLTAMRALLEPLRDGLIKTEQQRQQTYAIVLRETMRLTRLVSDMLELSRLQSGSVSMQRSTFDPASVFRAVHETYSVYAEDDLKQFIFDVPPVLPAVSGNPDRTQQVLIALLDNAFKYTPEDGRVTLRVTAEGDRLRVCVADTGIGISADDLPHVFDRFYKADKSHHSKGTGLGLAIAYEIMKHLGEEMTVQSTLGEGSEFSFTLHLAQPAPLPPS